MDLRRLRVGEWIVGASSVVLFVSLFLPWYRLEGRVPSSDPFSERIEEGLPLDISAFEAFSVFDVLLVLLAAAGVAVVVVTAIQRTAAVGIALQALLAVPAAVVVIALVLRVLNIPGDLEVPPGQPFEVSRTMGCWVGLVAAFGVSGGAVVAMRDERLSRGERLTDATGVPIDSPPEVEEISAPPAR